MDDKPIEFKIVVNGQAVEVKANTFDEIREAVERALKDSGNSGHRSQIGNCAMALARLLTWARRLVSWVSRRVQRCS